MKCQDCNFYGPAGADSYVRGGWCRIVLPFCFIHGNDIRRRIEYPESQGCDLGKFKSEYEAICTDCRAYVTRTAYLGAGVHFAPKCSSFEKES